MVLHLSYQLREVVPMNFLPTDWQRRPESGEPGSKGSLCSHITPGLFLGVWPVYLLGLADHKREKTNRQLVDCSLAKNGDKGISPAAR